MTVKDYIISMLEKALRIQELYPERALTGSTALFACGYLPVDEHLLIEDERTPNKWISVNDKPLLACHTQYPSDLDMAVVKTDRYQAVIELCGQQRYPPSLQGFACTKMDYPTPHDLSVVDSGSIWDDFIDFHGIRMQNPEVIVAVKELWIRQKDEEHFKMHKQMLLPRPTGDLVREAFENHKCPF